MRALLGSVAVHAVVAWLAFHGEHEGAPRARPDAQGATSMIELVEVAPVEVALVPQAASGSSPARARVTSTRSRAVDPRGTITIDHDARPGRGDVDSTRTGTGAGIGGSGTGTGIGFGDGGSVQRPQLLVPPPAPRGDPPSRARPARLIYPTRQREVEDAELFIARVIVDDDGYVAGARLVRGFGGRRDEVASQMIWKFRYAPALDDGGRPTQSTLEQRFLVGP